MVNVTILQITFFSDYFSFCMSLHCDRCGRYVHETVKVTKLTRLFAGCSQCEPYPSFSIPLRELLMDTVCNAWKYSVRDVRDFEEKLKPYDVVM